MKILRIVCVAAFTLIGSHLVAQTAASKVDGKITDEAEKAISGATVALKLAKDSSLIKMAAAEENGRFSFENIAIGSYFIQVTSIGFAEFTSQQIHLTASRPSYTASEIRLKPQAQDAQAVTVTARKPLIEARPGMMVVNVESVTSNIGLNALELIEKSPGITVDNDGNISLKGKQGVLVLVDGKPTYMSGADLAAFLKSMQSSEIVSLEIMTNPPAKYDAAGNSGIINIKTKKSLVKGMNGNLSAGYTQSQYSQGYANISLNYRNEKVNIFGGLGSFRYEGFNDLNIDRVFYKEDKTTKDGFSTQISRMHHQGFGNNMKAGLDYYISPKHVIGVLFKGNIQDSKDDSKSNQYIYNAGNTLTDNFYTQSDEDKAFKSLSGNINYKATLTEKGTELSADADYAHYNTRSNTFLNSDIMDHRSGNKSRVYLKGNIPSLINIYSAKIDFVHPLKNNWKVEAGFKSSWVNTDNQVSYLRSEDKISWLNDNRSNQFLFKENINAGYTTVSGVVKKWNFIAGLRAENTNSNGLQVVNDSTFTRHYTNLFPNVGVGYNLNDNNQFNLSYSRRINRPSYGDLNPFVFFLDSLTYEKGNPYLLPEFTQNFELTHAFKSILFTTLNYSITNDVIAEMLQQVTADKTTFQTKENVARRSQIGLSVMINTPIAKWWSMNTYLNVYNNRYTGIYNNDPLDIQFTTFVGNITNTLNFGKGWAAEIGGWYRSKGTEGLLVINGIYAVNGGISKKVLKDKGSIRLSFRDLFYTQKFSGYARYSDVDLNLSQARDSRRFTLGFTYRFGKTSISQARERRTGLEEEQSRAGGSNQN